MKSTVEQINTVQQRVKVTIPPESVNKTFSTIYERIRKKAKIQGFRPGKAPISMIRKLYGETVSNEVLDELIKGTLFDAIKEKGLTPIARPYVESQHAPMSDAEYEYSAVIDIMPVLSLGDQHKALTVSYKHTEFDQAMVEKEIKAMARGQAKSVPAADTDVAGPGFSGVVTIRGSHEGVPVPYLSAEKLFVDFGSEDFQPALDKAFAGMKVGESKETTLTLTEERVPEEIRGKEISVALTLHELKKLEIPAFDDELAKDLNHESMAQLREKTEQSVRKYVESANDNSMEFALLEALKNKVSFEVPPSIVDRVIDDMINEMDIKNESEKQRALQDNQLRMNCREEAKNRAKNTMLLYEIIKQENLIVTDDEVRAKLVSDFLPMFEQRVSSEDKIPFDRDALVNRWLKEGMGDRLKERLTFDKALGFLKSHCTLTKI